MNFNRTQTTNQRIERITMRMAVVGIDIAKEVHAAQATDFRGRALTPRHLSFTNESVGFEKLLKWIRQLQQSKRLTSVVVGLEPTGHYWFNLAHWLLDRDIPVVLVNPVTTHRNKENRDNSPSKNDPKDALIIADLVSRGYYTDYIPQEEVFMRIKRTMSTREYRVKQLVSIGNQIVRWIDLYFPEFSQVFQEWDGVRALASLKAFPRPSDLHGLTVDDVVQRWYEQGMRRAGGTRGREMAEALLERASRSIGDTCTPEEARKEIAWLLADYEKTIKELDELHKDMEALLGDMPMAIHLRSIPGMGTITIAALLACAGDLRLYDHGRQLLRRAGLNLAERTSGKHKGEIKLSKRGDSMLRKYLYWGVMSLVGQNPEFKQMHQRNQQRGMTKMASLFKCIGKLARIVIGMVKSEEPYRAEQLQQQLAA